MEVTQWDQNQIVGKLIATGRAKYEINTEKPQASGYVFVKDGGFQWTIDPKELSSSDITVEMLTDCIAQLEAMGTPDILMQKNGHKKDQGAFNHGIKIVSTKNPAIICSVTLQSSKESDCDILVNWFFDNNQEKFQSNGTYEREVSAAELSAVENARKEATMEAIDPVEKFMQEEEARVAASKKSLEESNSNKGANSMSNKKILSEKVDFFGMPIMEDESEKHVGVDSIGEKPKENDKSPEVVEKDHDKSKVLPPDIGDGKVKNVEVKGDGASKDQETELAKNKVKPVGIEDKKVAYVTEEEIVDLRNQIAKLSEQVKALSESSSRKTTLKENEQKAPVLSDEMKKKMRARHEEMMAKKKDLK